MEQHCFYLAYLLLLLTSCLEDSTPINSEGNSSVENPKLTVTRAMFIKHGWYILVYNKLYLETQNLLKKVVLK